MARIQTANELYWLASRPLRLPGFCFKHLFLLRILLAALTKQGNLRWFLFPREDSDGTDPAGNAQ